MRLKIARLLLVIFALFYIMPVGIASASSVSSPITNFAKNNDSCTSVFFGLPTWYKYLPLDENCNVNTDEAAGNVGFLILLGIADILMWLAGFLAVIFVIWGGFRFITSQGDPQNIAAARKTILNSLIGLVIAMVAAQIVNFIAGRLT